MKKVEETTDSGLIVVREAEEPSKGKPVRMIRAHHLHPSGQEIITEAHMEPSHKLSVEERKQRREDNKVMKEIRQRRGKKKHGRR